MIHDCIRFTEVLANISHEHLASSEDGMGKRTVQYVYCILCKSVYIRYYEYQMFKSNNTVLIRPGETWSNVHFDVLDANELRIIVHASTLAALAQPLISSTNAVRIAAQQRWRDIVNPPTIKHVPFKPRPERVYGFWEWEERMNDRYQLGREA